MVRVSSFSFVECARRFSRGKAFLPMLIAGVVMLGGCTTAEIQQLTDPIHGPDYAVANFSRSGPALPSGVRRVAVLPLSHNLRDTSGADGVVMLEPVLQAELSKARLFEQIYVTPAQLQQWTGKRSWDDFEELPLDLFTKLHEKTGCDAVLFSHLSRFKAYPPLFVGWRMKLVGNDGKILWSVDETFDAGEETVANSARRHDRSSVRNNPALADSRSILLSPSRFGQYAAGAVVATMPAR